MPHTRAKIRIMTTAEASAFVASLNTDGTADTYVIENCDSTYSVNARSLLGVVYALSDYNDNMFLVNEGKAFLKSTGLLITYGYKKD